MPSLLIANGVSFISACFTAASSWTKDPHRTYWYQVGQCLFYAAASYFFGVPSSIVMMLFSAFRNGLVASQHYTLPWMVFCAGVSLAAGLVVNGGNQAGYLSIFMVVYYTVSSFFLKEAKAVKLNLAFDLLLWFCYDLMVRDVPSGTMDFIGIVLAVIAFFRILGDERHGKWEKEESAC